jgi:multiple sugar transport system permease protein
MKQKYKRSSIERREARWFYLIISPWIVGFLVFTAYPMFASMFYSFTSWDMFSPFDFIGASNYVRLTQDTMFWTALYNTFYYASLYVPLSIILSLFVANLLNRKMKGQRVFRTLFYIPTLVPVVVSSLLFFRILAPGSGIVDRFLGIFGIKGPTWFFSEVWSKPALIIMSLWGLGTGFVLLLSGIQGIPLELYESARMDGSGKWVEFRHITLPMISSVIFYNLVIGIINALQIFTQVYVIGTNPLMPGGSSGSGAGPQNSLISIVQFLYLRAFREYNMGYASAIAWVLFIIILLFTMLIIRSSAIWTYYEAEVK